VVLALAYVSWRSVRAWRDKAAGCGGCKCAGPARSPSDAVTLISPEQVTLSRRNGSAR
jgi:hypothetical protein